MSKEIKEFIAEENINDEEFELINEYCKLRYASSVSQRKMSEKTGLAQSTIARLEKNLHSASLGNFIKILSVLGYHLEIKKNKKNNKKS